MMQTQLRNQKVKEIAKNITLDAVISGTAGFALGAIIGAFHAYNSIYYPTPNVAVVAVSCGVGVNMRYFQSDKLSPSGVGKGLARAMIYGLLGMETYGPGYQSGHFLASILKN